MRTRITPPHAETFKTPIAVDKSATAFDSVSIDIEEVGSGANMNRAVDVEGATPARLSALDADVQLGSVPFAEEACRACTCSNSGLWQVTPADASSSRLVKHGPGRRKSSPADVWGKQTFRCILAGVFVGLIMYALVQVWPRQPSMRVSWLEMAPSAAAALSGEGQISDAPQRFTVALAAQVWNANCWPLKTGHGRFTLSHKETPIAEIRSAPATIGPKCRDAVEAFEFWDLTPAAWVDLRAAPGRRVQMVMSGEVPLRFFGFLWMRARPICQLALNLPLLAWDPDVAVEVEECAFSYSLRHG